MLIDMAAADRLHRFRQSTAYRTAIICTCLLWATPLLAYTFNGAQMRLSGDDYCYNGILQVYGFWQMQWVSYTQLTLFNGNRYTLTLFSALAGLFGPQANGWLPGLALLIWASSLSWAIYWTSKALKFPLMGREAILLAVQAITLSLAQTPSLEQSLYWRSAMLPYLAPLAAFSLLAGCVCLVQLAGKILATRVGGDPTAINPGRGFSEVGAVLQLTLSGFATLLFGGAAYRDRGKTGGMQKNQAGWAAGANLAGSVIALLLLSLSPYLQQASTMLPERASLDTLRQMIPYNAAVFLHSMLKMHWLGWLCSLIATTSLAWIWSREYPKDSLSSRMLLRITSGIPIAGLVSVLVCMAPNAYIQQSSPELRALLLPQFAWMVTLMGLGIAGGLWLDKIARTLKISGLPLAWAALVLVLLTGFYVLQPSQEAFSQNGRYRRWAELWDVRDTEIRAAKVAGISDLEVIELDHIIPGVGELSPDSNYWYNNCAEMYYGINSIAANQPGWDK
jgi:hypothetical protein